MRALAAAVTAACVVTASCVPPRKAARPSRSPAPAEEAAVAREEPPPREPVEEVVEAPAEEIVAEEIVAEEVAEAPAEEPEEPGEPEAPEEPGPPPAPRGTRDVDPYMGEYVGTFTSADGDAAKAEAKVYPLGGGAYRVVLLTGDSRLELGGGSGGNATARLDVRRTDSPDGPKGLDYAYYEGAWNNLPDFDALTPAKTGTADYFGLEPSDREDQFGLEFTGFVKIVEPGLHTFATRSDDGSRMWVGAKQVLDNDGLHGMQQATGTIELEKGMHPVKVTFFENSGGEGLEVTCSAAPAKAGGEGLPIAGSEGGLDWKGRVLGDDLVASAAGPGGGEYRLRFTVRESPTLGEGPPAGAVVLLPFEEGEAPSLAEWTNQGWRALPDGSMEVSGGSTLTRREFGDARIHIEFRIPYVPAGRGQGRGNSGAYFQDRYEVQVLDSFGLVPQSNDCGGIYSIAKPMANACLPPTAWQTYDVTFRAARFDEGGKVTEEPWMTVRHNGITIHDHQKLPHSTTASGRSGHAKKGPIQLQDHGHRVRYRNIWLVEE